MQTILDRIFETRCQFEEHALFERLFTVDGKELPHVLGPALLHLYQAKRDLLRMNEERVNSPAIRRLVARRRVDQLPAYTLPEKLAKVVTAKPLAQRDLRDALYALVGEALFAQTDIERAVLVLAMEWHERVLARRLRLAVGLPAPTLPKASYLEPADCFLAEMHPHSAQTERALALCSRIHRAYAQFCDGLLQAIEAAQPHDTPLAA